MNTILEVAEKIVKYRQPEGPVSFTRFVGLVMLLPLAVEASTTDRLWEMRQPMNGDRLGLVACTVEGKVYAIGGYRAANRSALTVIEEYDPSSDIWTFKESMPTARRWLGAGVVDGQIFVCGGQGGSTATSAPLSTVEMYDIATNSWTAKADMPTARKGLSVAVVAGRVYAIGGADADDRRLSTVEMYDPATNSWSARADMPTPRALFATAVANGKIYAIGGPLPGSGGISTVEEYDPVLDVWTEKPSMRTGRWGVAAVTLNGYILALGGGSGTSGLPTVEIYDPERETWYGQSDMQYIPNGEPAGAAPSVFRNWGLASAVVENRIYAMGGASTGPPHPGTNTVIAYDAPPPVFVQQPAPVHIGEGARVVLAATVSEVAPTHYQWSRDGIVLEGETAPSITIPTAGATDTGVYSVSVSGPGGVIASDPAELTLADTPFAPPESRFVNLSTRGRVDIGDGVMIAGFSIGGVGAKPLLLRAVGPTLAEEPFSLLGTLSDPTVSLVAADGTVLASNDNWEEGLQSDLIESVTLDTGAFPLVENSRDSVLFVSLHAGEYTLVVEGVDGGAGVSIVEVYDADPAAAAYLQNISTRGIIGLHDDAMIPGFVVGGSNPGEVLLRGVGPTLADPPFEIANTIGDPELQIIASGGGVLAVNDNWSDVPSGVAALKSAAEELGAFPLSEPSVDAAVLLSLAPGVYTAPITGVNGDTGIGLAEAYLFTKPQ